MNNQVERNNNVDNVQGFDPTRQETPCVPGELQNMWDREIFYTSIDCLSKAW